MKTPICDFIKEYSRRGASRLHMPGHKGRGALGCESFDITEICGADELYHSSGIIRESEETASSLFGTARTLYSTEGSSLCIRAMLYLTKLFLKETGKKPLILAARNAHKAFINSAALLDIAVEWIYPEGGSLFSCDVCADILEKRISEASPSAVYITSPDYLGNVADIKELSAVCKKHGCLLLVDNAHGAYLKFLTKSLHPIDLGADMCCDSAHKTLPVLTGGAYLHISRSCPKFFSDNAESALSLFASTSPSYLILQSLDAANKALSGVFSEKLLKVSSETEKLRSSLSQRGYSIAANEPLKLTIAPKAFGYTGGELYDILSAHNIVCEFADADFLVMMFSCNTRRRDFRRLEKVLMKLPRKPGISVSAPALLPGKARLRPHEVLFSPKELRKIEDCEGKIFAGAPVSCPPAIPIVIYGEEINKTFIESFKYYGVSACEVVSGL